jgi:UDP:flavonoid glycosyltransferase YjiC (YdhE family)
VLNEAEEDADLPPPSYGDSYGEIRDEKSGLGTTANVTDDGRVNIHINQFNQRLSKLLAPALHQETEAAEQAGPSPPPYIPSSLGGDKTTPPPPPLNIVIQVVGSRGDVQPFVALGKVLKNSYGHRVRLATHATFKNFVEENGVEFFSIGGDPAALMAFMVQNPRLMPGFRSVANGSVRRQRQNVSEYIQGCWRSCYEAGDGLPGDNAADEPEAKPFVADCIIANPPSFAHIHCAERLSVPLHIMFTMAYSPTQAFPHPLANIQSSNADPQLTNYISYGIIELLSWQGLGEIINRFRVKCLGLDPVSLVWAPGMLHRLKIPHTYFWSPALIPKPKDWGPQIDVSGFSFLDLATDYTPPSELVEFLDAGPPPIYIGFGSIVLEDPDAMTKLILEAVRITGQRVLLSKGWGGIGADDLDIPDGVFLLGNMPHDWLFKHVSCVVHHGGAGTTAAGIVASRPTAIVPFFGDQPFWGAMIAQAGTGPKPIPAAKLTVESLADAIRFCLRPETQENAKELASKMAAERGSDTAAQLFHRHLGVDALRCMLAPTQAAVWRVKRSKIILSPFAACTLVNSNLLTFQDLKLYKPRDYVTDEGPFDPISGGFVAFVGAVGGMSRGLLDVPSETWKAAKLPFRAGGSHGEVSKTRTSGESSIRPAEGRSSSASQSLASLDLQASANTEPKPSSPASSHLASMSSSQNDVAKAPKSEKSRGKERDMLRHKGAHASKGLGRFATALAEGPMDIALGMNKGLYNLPRAWGDDTVRRPDQVTGFRSGFKAAGKDFGLGWYDGISGLVTQPWKGAQKDGASGFFKGVGKGVGGFVAKPCATIFGVPGYMMKGVQKGCRKWFATNVQDHIFASRAAQGYEEWLKSTEEERQDVIKQWGLVKEYLDKKSSSDEMLRQVLEAQQKINRRGRQDGQELSLTSGPSTITGSQSVASDSSVPSRNDTHSVARSNRNERVGSQDMSQGEAGEDFSSVTMGRRAEQQDTPETADAVSHPQLIDPYNGESSRGHRETPTSLNELSRNPQSSASRHLAGVTRSQFEENQLQGEKTAEEKNEEVIVMEYIKKQSLLEQQHWNKGKNRATGHTEEDEELRLALELSLQDYKRDIAHRYSGTARA